MNNGKENRHVIIVERKDILGLTVKQNHKPQIKGMREDQEINSNQDQDLLEIVIIAENQDINKLNVKQESTH